MAGEWPQSTVGEVSQRVTKGTTPTTIGGRFVEKGIAFVKVESITDDGRFDQEKFAFIDDETNLLLARSVLHEDDVLFTIAGTIGRVARVHQGVLPANTNQAVAIVRPNREVIDPRFLYYVLRDDVRVKHAHTRVVQSVQANFSLSELSGIEVPLPSMDEQCAIAHILGTLDDKIELNRRMNETLETMARATFKSWFVDFDPVRAKAEGRDPGLPKPIADLFPDRFEDTELGEIPTGWNIGSILAQARLLNGGTPKTDREEFWGGEIPWASAKDVSQCGQTFLVATERTITTKGLEESATQLIPAFCSTVVARGATTGRMVLFGRDMAMNQTCYALASTIDTPLALYCWLRLSINDLVHAAHGSVFDTITTSTFESSKVVLASERVLRTFEERVTPLFHRILAGIEQIRSLSAVRDTLLPKLISGELRVPDATAEAGAACA